MLRVFVSSTFRDLMRERETLLDTLKTVLVGVGMENFIPDGKTSQEIGIEELRNSDVVIFLISTCYGSLIKECRIKDCAVKCQLKKRDGISFTQCEYNVALAENKLHQAYIVDKDWDVIKELKKWKGKPLDWRQIRDKKVFDELTTAEIEHHHEVAERVWDFKEKAEREFCKRIKDDQDFKTVTNHLASNIINWYSEGKINLQDFCGRRKELKDLFRKMSDSVEVFGVGGIGKTTLIHVALLIQKLRGKKIVTVGKKQSYLTGSGYKYFREKCQKEQHEIIGNNISLDDIMDALTVPDDVRVREKKEKMRIIPDMIEKRNIILFIDDFHLADRDVKDLVKNAKSVVISSKKRTGIARSEVPLFGIVKNEREELIKVIEERLSITVSDEARKRIWKMAEGHPVSTEVLLRNYEKIDFQELKDFKKGLDLSKPEHSEEFLKRVVKDVLSAEAFDLLRNLSVINTDLENNLDKETIEKTYATSNFAEVFAELIDAGMLKKKEGRESVYEFSYRHIQEAVGNEK